MGTGRDVEGGTWAWARAQATSVQLGHLMIRYGDMASKTQLRLAGVLMMPLRGVNKKLIAPHLQAAEEFITTLGVAKSGLVLATGAVNATHEDAFRGRHLLGQYRSWIVTHLTENTL